MRAEQNIEPKLQGPNDSRECKEIKLVINVVYDETPFLRLKEALEKSLIDTLNYFLLD